MKEFFSWKISAVLFIVTFFFFSGCGYGIEPEPAPVPTGTGFAGTVTFSGEWPEGVKRTHIVLFKQPLLSVSDFNPFNLFYVSNEITYGTRQFRYNTKDNVISDFFTVVPGEYAYLAVAQSKTDELQLDRDAWYVVSVYRYEVDTTQAGKIVIPENMFLTGIDLLVDFSQLPPQPPGGLQ